MERDIIYRQRFAEFSTEGLLAGYDIVVCSHCGMCFGDRIPEQEAFDRYYAVMSKYEAPRPPGDSADPNQKRLLDVVPFIERAARQSDEILEIGCASGQLLHLLRQRGFTKVRGIDPSPMCAQIAREHYGIEASCATFSCLTPKEPVADLVILVTVLEHVRDLEQPIAVLRQLVPIGGKLFITVPDATHYVDGIDAPFQEFSVEHINFFGPLSLANLMRVHGFETLFCESANVQANTTTLSAVIHGAFERRAPRNGSEPNAISRDDMSERAIRDYVAKSQHDHEQVVPILDRLAKDGEPLVVWGAGAHTLRLLAQSPLGHANIISIIDSNPRYQGKRIGSIPVIGPEQRPDSRISILVSSRVYQNEICQQIRTKLNWKNPLITLY